MTNESKIKDVIRRILGQAETEDKMVDMLYQLLTPSQVDVEAVKEEYESIFVRKEVKRVDTSNSIELPLWKDNHSHLSVDIWNFFAPYLTPKTDSRELLERFAEFCHEHYLGCSQNNGSKSGFEYAYEAEVVFMVNEYLQSMKEKE